MRMLSITAIGLFFIGFAGAADSSIATQAPTATQAEQDAPVGTAIQTAGKVTSMHTCPMVGVSDPHILVKLLTEQGDTDIVDLGSAAELKANGVEPKEGQQYWVDGQVGKINDKFLIVAQRISESKLVTIARSMPLREETVKHAEAHNAVQPVSNAQVSKDPQAPKTETKDAGQQVRTVEGTVIHTRNVAIEGESGEHTLAKLQTETGIAVVDLGVSSAMPTVNLTAGQAIVVVGSVGQLNGKPIILADSVGNMNAIKRSECPATTPASPK